MGVARFFRIMLWAYNVRAIPSVLTRQTNKRNSIYGLLPPIGAAATIRVQRMVRSSIC